MAQEISPAVRRARFACVLISSLGNGRCDGIRRADGGRNPGYAPAVELARLEPCASNARCCASSGTARRGDPWSLRVRAPEPGLNVRVQRALGARPRAPTEDQRRTLVPRAQVSDRTAAAFEFEFTPPSSGAVLHGRIAVDDRRALPSRSNPRCTEPRHAWQSGRAPKRQRTPDSTGHHPVLFFP